ncbi:MAG: type I-U CRISPR-associated protein Csx17 [Acidobacteriota bacterium]
MNEITLYGCAPQPLIYYLKALGILRLVAEQFDREVRAAWQGDLFSLFIKQNADELMEFFLSIYSPTPILAPWNGGSGFYPQDKNQRAMIEQLCRIKTARLNDYRETFAIARKLIGARNVQPKDEEKAEILRRARTLFSDRVIAWLDAAYVLGEEKPDYPPLLGSGGNDGRLDFTINFVARLISVLPDCIRESAAQEWSEKQVAGNLTSEKISKLEKKLSQQTEQQVGRSQQQLRAALFQGAAPKLEAAAVGQFYPAGVGGANADQGTSGDSLVNPWDFILAIEGTLMLASATVRQLAAGARSRASFPFTARNAAVGYGTAVAGEKIRAEIWLPLWSRPASYYEIAHIFSEGRVQFGSKYRRSIQSGFDFARAISELGVDRGIEAFQRYGFIERNGQANLATPLGRFEVQERPRATLVYQFDRWLDELCRATGDTKTPPRFIRRREQIEENVFNLCASGEAEHLRATLIALGTAEAELARSPRFRDEKRLKPLFGLSERWAVECDDHSSEFDIAVALAAIIGEGSRDPMRASIEPVTINNSQIDWTSDETAVVWNAGILTDNLAAVLNRRSIAARAAGASHPAIYSRRACSLSSIAEFLNKQTDDEQIENLLRGLSLINWSKASGRLTQSVITMPPTLPRAYALLKLLFLLNGRLVRYGLSESIIIRHEPSLIPLLCAGRVAEALEIAERRLRATGLIPFTSHFYFPDEDGTRLAASLLIPIAEQAQRMLAKLVLRPTTEETPITHFSVME